MGFRGRLMAATGVTSGEFTGAYTVTGTLDVVDPGLLRVGNPAGARVELHPDANTDPTVVQPQLSLFTGTAGEVAPGEVSFDDISRALRLRAPSRDATLTRDRPRLDLSAPTSNFAGGLIVDAAGGQLELRGDEVRLSAPLGGDSAPLRIDSTVDASLSSTRHGFQIGPDSGSNMRIDNNEILSVNNGAPETLFLQLEGGRVQIGGGAGGLLRLPSRAGDPFPEAGGGFLYVKSGALWYVGSAGTITRIALS